jgi:hypothetical protein
MSTSLQHPMYPRNFISIMEGRAEDHLASTSVILISKCDASATGPAPPRASSGHTPQEPDGRLHCTSAVCGGSGAAVPKALIADVLVSRRL